MSQPAALSSSASSVLEIEDLVVTYGHGKDAFHAVDGIDLAIPGGGTLGLVGESGCGKSTVARALVGLTRVASGRIILDGRDCTNRRLRQSLDFRRRVQMVFQDPYSSLNPRMTVGTMMLEALSPRRDRTRRVTRGGSRRQEAQRVLDLVGLPTSAYDRYPHQFSGGQRQRIAIARALAVEPEIIVLDEVTSALDVSVQATILNLLRDLQAEFKLSYLFISHDLAVVRHMSDLVAAMYLGRIVERGPGDVLFKSPKHPYTRALADSIPSLTIPTIPEPIAGDAPDPHNPPDGCRFHPRCPIGPNLNPERTVCTTVDPRTVAAVKPHNAACHFAEEVEQPASFREVVLPSPG